jgi:hypothetical protein
MDEFFGLFSRIFKTPLMVLNAVLGSSMGRFVQAIMSKWYILIAISGSTVVFWVLKALQDAGILDTAFKLVFDATRDAKAIAQHCVPKILNLDEMWNCISNIDQYTYSGDDDAMYKSLMDTITKQSLDGAQPHENGNEAGLIDPYAK